MDINELKLELIRKIIDIDNEELLLKILSILTDQNNNSNNNK